MRVVHVTGMQSKKFGSLEEFFVALAAECRSRNHSLTVVYDERPYSAPYLRKMTELGADVEVFAPSPAGTRQLCARMRALAPEVIHTHFGRLPYLFLAARRLLAKNVYWTKHNLLQAGANPRGAALWLHRGLARRARRVYCVSEAIRAELVDKGIRGNTETRYVGINLDRFAPAADGNKPALVNADVAGKIVITCVAIAIPAKGVEYFVRAIADVVANRRELRFLHVGGGELVDSLQALAASLGVRKSIQFLGVRNDIETVLAASDITVLPSLSEGLGLAAVEAMAAGKPVVASRAGGIPEVVADGRNGLLVPPGDAAALARAIGRLVDDDELRARLGAAARAQVAEHFDVQKSVSRLVDDYEADLR